MKRISVIVPIYNCSSMLRYCIDSLCEQTIDKDLIEILLIDDASTDGSSGICKEYAELYEYIRVITLQENQGQSVARNEGLNHSNGEYIAFVDADDWLGPDCLRRLLSHAEEKGSDVTIGRVIAVDRIEKVGRVAWCRGNKKEIVDDTFENNWDFYASMGPWGRLIKRKLLIENQIFFPVDMYMFEDIYWNMQILHAAKSAVIVNDYDYYYLRRDSGTPSLTTNEEELNNSIKPENLLISIDRLATLAEKYGYGDEHPAWKRIFIIAVKDAFMFISYAARIAPQKYPDSGRDFKKRIWDRVKPHYSAWIRENISTELICRFDAMVAGYDYDYDYDPIRYYAKGRFRPSELAARIKDCDISIEEYDCASFLSEEARLKLLSEQIESMAFYSTMHLEDRVVRGTYFVPTKVVDNLEFKMMLYCGEESFPLTLKMTPNVWGEAYQEIGQWEAKLVNEVECKDIDKIEYTISLHGMELRVATVAPWNEEMGRPEVVNPIREELKLKKKQLAEATGDLRKMEKKLDEMDKRLASNNAKLVLAKETIEKMRASYSWKITKPLRKAGNIIRSKDN